jgi:hypothetical protein
MAGKRYWKADAATSAKIVGWMRDWEKALNAARKLAKSLGASNVYTSYGGHGDPCVAGFAFCEPPDKKLFAKLKNTTDGYRPRAGSALEKQVDEFRCHAAAETMQLVGVKPGLEFGDDGFYMTGVGIHIVGKVAYLTTRANKAKGCKRISDIEYERATKKKL